MTDVLTHIGKISLLQRFRLFVAMLVSIFATPFNVFSINPNLPDTTPMSEPLTRPAEVVQDRILFTGDSAVVESSDTVPVIEGPIAELDSLLPGSKWDQEWVERKIDYNPSPTRAVWMSALFPGLGQVYNRRYWKLPIIVGGYLGLGYATSWNNMMLTDYTKAYADLTDNDPSTKSYMDFFPSTVKEEDLDRNWLNNILKSRKNFYRRNRDLCVICMIGVYLLAMVDAYVDASLAHFDISPDLTVDVMPAVMQDSRGARPSIGLQWAFNF